MKKLIILVAAFVAFASTSLYAQDYTKEGKTYVQQSKQSTKTEEKTGFTYKDSKGVEYDIYIGKTGSCYIKRVSKNTGNEYKQYLGEEISKDICKQLNREYTPKSK